MMRKLYIKPELYYEDFELAEAITACGTIAGPTDGNFCTWDGFVEGLPMFNSQVNANCLLDYSDYEDQGLLNVFGS